MFFHIKKSIDRKKKEQKKRKKEKRKRDKEGNGLEDQLKKGNI